MAGPGYWFNDMEEGLRRGWRWTHDPQFAWMIENYYGRKDMSEKEWAELEQAAAQQPRAPWLENRSRTS